MKRATRCDVFNPDPPDAVLALFCGQFMALVGQFLRDEPLCVNIQSNSS